MLRQKSTAKAIDNMNMIFLPNESLSKTELIDMIDSLSENYKQHHQKKLENFHNTIYMIYK